MHLIPKPLRPESFAAYGDVIELNKDPIMINEGFTQRFHDLAKVEVGTGHTLINIFRTSPKAFPIAVTYMERHPLGSQAFIPLSKTPFLVLVAAKGKTSLNASDLELFITNGQQGVNYHKNVWHHYCLALRSTTDFLVVDRGGEGNNLEEVQISGDKDVVIDQSAANH